MFTGQVRRPHGDRPKGHAKPAEVSLRSTVGGCKFPGISVGSHDSSPVNAESTMRKKRVHTAQIRLPFRLALCLAEQIMSFTNLLTVRRREGSFAEDIGHA